MNFICNVCGASVDSCGFKTAAPDNDEPTQELNCVNCRLEAMRRKAVHHTRPRPRPAIVPVTRTEEPQTKLPYKDL